MHEFLVGTGIVVLYFLIAASTAFLCRVLIKIPQEVFRKALHFILLGSYIPFVFAFETWWKSVLLAILFAIVVYPVLGFFERFQNYTEVTTERRKDEFKSSLLLAFAMLAVAISICRGWLDDRYLVLACMYAWGVGDAFAALIGKRFGKHKLCLKYVDSHKSLEGTLAMFATSLVAVMIVLMCRGGLNVAGYIVIPIIAGGVSATVELYTPGGMDTVTCPMAALLTIVPLVQVFGG
ncbi:MAG: phosphatidate cytidylyltransferase [Lachnospiraceae bacterium]|nr:phosphatidate cytidylyltransferase [Lachnospiraceae bacterium]